MTSFHAVLISFFNFFLDFLTTTVLKKSVTELFGIWRIFNTCTWVIKSNNASLSHYFCFHVILLCYHIASFLLINTLYPCFSQRWGDIDCMLYGMIFSDLFLSIQVHKQLGQITRDFIKQMSFSPTEGNRMPGE